MPKFDRALLLTYLRPEWPRAVLLGLLLFTGIGLQLANPQIVKSFIDQAQSGMSIHGLMWIGALLLGVVILSQVATVAETYVAEDLGWRTTNALRAHLTQRVLELDGSFHSEHGPGELIERIDGDVAAIADFFARFVLEILGGGVFLLGVLILLFVVDWRIGAVLTVFSLLALVIMARGGGFVSTRAQRSLESAADLTGFLEERLAGMPDLKANGADAYTLHRLEGKLAARFRRAWSVAIAGSIFNGAIGVVFAVATGAALAVSAALHESGVLSLGAVYVVFRYTGMLQQPLEQLALQMNQLQQATGGIVRVRELLDTHSAIVGGALSGPFGGAPSLDVDDVSFTYDTLPVLHEVSFSVKSGEVLGLLGRTGSGKTTVARLLFRLYDPSHGSVRLDGANIREMDLARLRAGVGFVTQDVQLFQGTLRENVALFDRTVPDRAVEEAFAHLGLRPWLASLPGGLDEPIGIGGRGLSAGEAQLVGLARVFLKEPGVVVLDEPSSRLDPATLALVETGITRLLQGRTGVVIAHRLETVERADMILILEGGRVAEFGRRADLAADSLSRFSQLLHAGIAEVLA